MILIDLNILLDVVQHRQPHYLPSAAVLEEIIQNKTKGAIAAHSITTVHYIVQRHANKESANKLIDWLLRYLSIIPADQMIFLRARAFDWNDFEDAVTAAAAESSGCTAIITRNVKDFPNSPVMALTPEEYLLNTEHPNH